MKSRAVGRFWRLYDKLPAEIRRTADKQFALWLNNPRHRSLRFKQVRPNLWSARVTDDYRALATRDGETFLWFWIGPHDEYQRLLRE
jgi:hypothetical protein